MKMSQKQKTSLILITILAISTFTALVNLSHEATCGVLSLTFDDSSQNQYSYIYPYLKDKGLAATFYVAINESNNNPNIYGQITPTQLLEMQNAGMEIGSHSMTHPDFTTLTDSQINYECNQSKTTLQSYGLNITDFAYPYGLGDYTNHINSIVQKYYDSARTAIDQPQTVNSHGFALYCNDGEYEGVDPTAHMNYLKSLITYAAQNNLWLIIIIHNVNSNYDVAVNYGALWTGDFNDIVSFALDSGIRILTVHQALMLGVGANSTPTSTPTPTPTSAPTVTPTIKPTATPTTSPVPSYSPTASPTPTPIPTTTPTKTPTPTPTLFPTPTPTLTPQEYHDYNIWLGNWIANGNSIEYWKTQR